MTVERPPNRRKTYRYFQNLDYIKFKNEFFIRLPNQREHHHISSEDAKIFVRAVVEKAKDIRQNSVKFRTADGECVPILRHPSEMLDFAASIARKLIENGTDQKTS